MMKGLSKDTLCIMLTVVVVGLGIWLVTDYTRKREMFELIHILSNGDILWYAQQGRYSMPISPRQEPSPQNGPVQPYLVKCSEDKNQQLCQYLKTNQAPPQQFAGARAYSDYAYMRAMAPAEPNSAFHRLNTTWG